MKTALKNKKVEENKDLGSIDELSQSLAEMNESKVLSQHDGEKLSGDKDFLKVESGESRKNSHWLFKNRKKVISRVQINRKKKSRVKRRKKSEKRLR